MKLLSEEHYALCESKIAEWRAQLGPAARQQQEGGK
jgi:hypothetical protein